MKLTQPLICKRVGMSWVHNNMMVILNLVVLQGEKVFIRSSPEEPPLPVKIGNLLASPDGATGHGGAITSHPPVG